ncbi:EthD family reductase [Paenarthrobacter sp. NPDC057981]|uniref:EthD family reductase n=1 Tax=Paenarthrobacter sp. NPDC057981 TaxID=3346297 RepID=UPI0036DD7E10
MSYSLAFLTRPAPGISYEEFFDHYTRIHRPLAEQLPELLYYRQTRIDKSGYRGDDAIEYSAFSEYVFESAGAAERAWRSPEAKVLDQDAALFMDGASVLTMPLNELGTYGGRRSAAGAENE